MTNEQPLPRAAARLEHNWRVEGLNPLKIFDGDIKAFSNKVEGLDLIRFATTHPDETNKVLSVLLGAHRYAAGVLGVPDEQVEFSFVTNEHVYFAFRMTPEGIPQIHMNADKFNEVIGDFGLLSVFLAEVTKYKYLANNEELETDIQVMEIKCGLALAEIIFAISHEVYHLGQALKNPAYYNESLDSNEASRRAVTKSLMTKLLGQLLGDPHTKSEKKNAQEWETEAGIIISQDRGERSGIGFGIRVLQEIERAMENVARPQAVPNELSKLFSEGCDEVIEEWTDELKKRFEIGKDT